MANELEAQQLGQAGATPELAAAEEAGRIGLSRVRPQRSLWSNAFRQFRHHHLAMAGVFVFLFFAICCFLGPLVYTRPVDSPFLYDAGLAPSLKHLMGTDSIGQDILARIFYGGRISLSVGIVAATVAIIIGTLVGAMAGFFGGAADSVLMRFTDLFISLPQLPLLLLITFLYKDKMMSFFDKTTGSANLGVFVLIVGVIGGLAWMTTARLVRASFLSVREKEFVEAARSVGASRSSLIFKHILPNVMSPIIVAATLEVAGAIISESALSFLGLGFPSDVPTWGVMLFNAQNYMQLYPHEALMPGMMIFLTVLAINYIGDGLRDALDPRKTN